MSGSPPAQTRRRAIPVREPANSNHPLRIRVHAVNALPPRRMHAVAVAVAVEPSTRLAGGYGLRLGLLLAQQHSSRASRCRAEQARLARAMWGVGLAGPRGPRRGHDTRAAGALLRAPCRARGAAEGARMCARLICSY